VCSDGLHDKLEDIAWIDEQPWRESLAITSQGPTEVADIDDDLERELAFYNQVGGEKGRGRGGGGGGEG